MPLSTEEKKMYAEVAFQSLIDKNLTEIIKAKPGYNPDNVEMNSRFESILRFIIESSPEKMIEPLEKVIVSVSSARF